MLELRRDLYDSPLWMNFIPFSKIKLPRTRDLNSSIIQDRIDRRHGTNKQQTKKKLAKRKHLNKITKNTWVTKKNLQLVYRRNCSFHDKIIFSSRKMWEFSCWKMCRNNLFGVHSIKAVIPLRDLLLLMLHKKRTDNNDTVCGQITIYTVTRWPTYRTKFYPKIKPRGVHGPRNSPPNELLQKTKLHLFHCVILFDLWQDLYITLQKFKFFKNTVFREIFKIFIWAFTPKHWVLWKEQTYIEKMKQRVAIYLQCITTISIKLMR